MDNLRRDVHLLKNIVTFRAACMSENFTAAARELGVSRVAVSRQIAELEQALGMRLFIRNHRHVTLTRSGEVFAKTVNPALQAIADAMNQQRANTSKMRVTITVTSAFATYWLMPRLVDFGAKHPEIEVNLVASDRNLDLASEGIDIAVRYGPTKPEGPGWVPIMQEEIFPVFAPGYEARTELMSASDLLKERLLYLSGTYRPEAGWPYWFRHHGLAPPEARAGIQMNTYINMLQAAIEGQGIALAGHPLVDSFLDTRALSRMEHVAPLKRDWYFLFVSEDSDAACVFRDWVEAKFATQRATFM
ncbi:MAG: LysR substrate-binding domain-containing protein [Pseudomonadota bacterium]